MNRFIGIIKNYPSFFILLLPYSVLVYPEIYTSTYFSFLYFTLILAFFFIFDILLRHVLNKYPKIIIAINILYVIVAILFYETFFLSFTTLRIRTASFIFFCVLYGYILFHKGAYNFLNRLCIFFSIVLTINIFFFKKEEKKLNINYHSSTIGLSNISKSNESVILIILDEYASPQEFDTTQFKPNPFAFNLFLNSTGWITKPGFISSERRTINSISSIFNLNLSNSNEYSNAEESVTSRYLLQARLVSSLTAKGIKFNNYSFFRISENEPFRAIRNNPNSFIDLFMINSILFQIKLGVGIVHEMGYRPEFDVTSKYNEEILNELNKVVNSEGAKRQFYYFHLLMPHAPIRFSNEIYIEEYNLNNYFEYWTFTNAKIRSTLLKASHLKDYRVIISGDHGFRRSEKVNERNTYGAFYRFDSSSVSQVSQVQDLGKLIDASF